MQCSGFSPVRARKKKMRPNKNKNKATVYHPLVILVSGEKRQQHPSLARHSREGGNPGKNAAARRIQNWMPAYAGMTTVMCHRSHC
ncbi:MAG: hypothetical protein H7Y02_12320, partial [Candidatus Obscuribacterales bacterium]|nr:hypothetical protein [Steroidobacteraceae bacterium]